MSVVKKIAKNAIVSSIGEILSKILLFLLTIIIARYLGSDELGKYSFAISFSALFFIFADMGLNKLFIRDVAKNNKLFDKYLFNIIVIKSFLAIITMISIYICINFTNSTTEIKYLVYLAGLYIILSESLATLFRNVFVIFEIQQYEAIYLILENLIIFIIGYIAIINNYKLFSIFIGLIIASIIRLILQIITIFKLTKPKLEIQPLNFYPLLIKAFPFCMGYLFAILYLKIDITMLTFMKGTIVVGWYTAAYNIISALMLFPSVFMRAVFPNMSKYYCTNKQKFTKSFKLSFKYLITLVIPIIIGGIIVSKNLILLIYTEKFINSIITLQILLWALLFYFIKIPLNNVLYILNDEKKIMWTYLLGVFVNVGFNFLLIPSLSYIGAGISTVISEITTTGIILYWLSKKIKNIKLLKYFYKPLISVTIMSFVVYNISYYQVIFQIIFGAIIYFIILFLIKGINKEDIMLFKQIFKKDVNRKI